MNLLLLGDCHLTVKKSELKKILHEIYMSHYKRDRLRHVTRNDKRIPNIKVTSDIFSLCVYFKDKSKKENRIFFDGTSSLENITINTITLDGEEFNTNEYNSILELLKTITTQANGYVLFGNHHEVGRIKNGTISNEKQLMKEIYQTSPDDRSKEDEKIFQWMMEYERTK